MLDNEQLERLHTLTQFYIEELPDPDAQDVLVLLLDVCEILELAPEAMAAVFGPATLTWVTGLAYGERASAA